MNSGKRQALEEAYEKLMAISFNQIPVEDIEELVDPEVMGYGTTIDEQIHDLEGYIKLIRRREEQADTAGLDFTFDRNRIHKRLSPYEDTAIIVEEITTTLKSDNIRHQFIFRFSAVKEYGNNSWKLINWHGSIPSDTENDPWHINEWKAEKKKLEKLVDERTQKLKEAQEQLIQQEKLESLGQLAAGIAHEIKNPLNFVNNFSDLILELVEEVRHEIRDMRRENNRETLNVKGERSLRQPAESAEAERRRGLSDYQPKLTLRTFRNENTVTIEIEDNGLGIPDEMKDKIMQPFFTTKKGTAGTGLGLSITNDIIKAHGGSLSIAKTSVEGTTFRIELRDLP